MPKKPTGFRNWSVKTKRSIPLGEVSIEDYRDRIQYLLDGNSFFSKSCLEAVLLGNPKALKHSFTWRMSVEGHTYWERRRNDRQPLSSDDLNFIEALMKYVEDSGMPDNYTNDAYAYLAQIGKR